MAARRAKSIYESMNQSAGMQEFTQIHGVAPLRDSTTAWPLSLTCSPGSTKISSRWWLLAILGLKTWTPLSLPRQPRKIASVSVIYPPCFQAKVLRNTPTVLCLQHGSACLIRTAFECLTNPHCNFSVPPAIKYPSTKLDCPLQEQSKS